MSLDASTVKHIANLARLEVADAELDGVTDTLSRILMLVEQLDAADTDGIEPMAHPLKMTQRLRADVVTETNQRDRFQASAPAVEAGLYLVPRVIE